LSKTISPKTVVVAAELQIATPRDPEAGDRIVLASRTQGRPGVTVSCPCEVGLAHASEAAALFATWRARGAGRCELVSSPRSRAARVRARLLRCGPPSLVGPVASEGGACGILTLALYAGARRTRRLAGEEHVVRVQAVGVAPPEPQGARRINTRGIERPCRIDCRERPLMASNRSLMLKTVTFLWPNYWHWWRQCGAGLGSFGYNLLALLWDGLKGCAADRGPARSSISLLLT
jgi:hypothetical protein